MANLDRTGGEWSGYCILKLLRKSLDIPPLSGQSSHSLHVLSIRTRYSALDAVGYLDEV